MWIDIRSALVDHRKLFLSIILFEFLRKTAPTKPVGMLSAVCSHTFSLANDVSYGKKIFHSKIKKLKNISYKGMYYICLLLHVIYYQHAKLSKTAKV